MVKINSHRDLLGVLPTKMFPVRAPESGLLPLRIGLLVEEWHGSGFTRDSSAVPRVPSSRSCGRTWSECLCENSREEDKSRKQQQDEVQRVRGTGLQMVRKS